MLQIGNRRSNGPVRSSRAFTLVELLLVMALLIVVVSVAAPSLRPFFHGRTLDSEARRLLALTHAGQSRAVSEGVPMVLWLDAKSGSYGLEAQSGFEDSDTRAEEFKLDERLKLEVVESAGTQYDLSALAAMPPSGAISDARLRNLPAITFQPDGSIELSSPRAIRLEGTDGESLWLAQSTNRLNYEIVSQFR